MGLITPKEAFGDNFDKVTAAPSITEGLGERHYGALDVVPELGKGIARGFLNLGAGVVGTADWLAETASAPLYAMVDDATKERMDRFNEFVFDDRKRKIVMAGKSLPADPENAAGWAGAVIGEAIPYMAASIAGASLMGGAAAGAGVKSAAGLKAASMAGAASVGFAVEGEMAYQNAIDGGATKGQANAERLIVGTINAAIEALQVSDLMKVGKKASSLRMLKDAAKKKAFKKIGKQSGILTQDVLFTAIGEGLEEGGQELTSLMVPAMLRDDIQRNEDGTVDWTSFFGRIGGSVLGGAVVGGFFGGAKIMSGRTVGDTNPRHFRDIDLDQATEIVKTNRPKVNLTKEEKKYAKHLSQTMDISFKEAKEILSLTAPRRFGADMSKAEKAEAVRLQMGEGNMETLGSSNEQAMEDTLNWAYNQGGVPTSQDMRNDFMTDMRAGTRLREKQLKYEHKMKMKGREANKLKGFQAIRYALGDMSVASGYPLHTTWGDMNVKAKHGKNEAVRRMTRIYDELGLNPMQMSMDHTQNDAIAKFLFDGDVDAIQDLDENQQALALELNKVLQEDGRQIVSLIRWKMWNEHGIEPDSLGKKNREGVLEAGRAAQEKGKLKEWLAKQDWTAKEHYYMTEGHHDSADAILKTMQPADVSKKRKTKKPKTTPSEARTRKKKHSEWKKGSVVDAVHNHLSRLHVSLAVMDDMSTFWGQFQEANPSQRDSAMMKRFVDNMLGRRMEAEPVAEILKKSTTFFWRFHFFNPAKAAYFFTRNILQNAYMGSQVSITEVYKAGKELLRQHRSGQRDEQRVSKFEEVWRDSISQKQQMWEQALLMEQESSVGGGSKRLLNKAMYHADKWGSWAIKSDSINRMGAWNLYYQIGKKVLQDYHNGDITWKQLQAKLKLNTLHFSQSMEMMQLIDRPVDFVEKFAEYKTENTHFRYETTLRSGAEQSTLSRALAGLMVYPRGVANIIYTNGFVPMMNGMKTKNWDQAYSGFKSLLMLAIGMGTARELLKTITGRDSYGLVPEYQPLGPGVTIISDNVDRIMNIKYRMGQGDISTQDAVEEVMMVAADNLELVVPLFDLYADYYESNNDASGVRFSRLVKSRLKEEYPDFTYQERSYWEKIAHIIWGGGFEEVED